MPDRSSDRRGDRSGGDAPLRVGVLASGRGSNFAAIVAAAEAGRHAAQPVVLVTDRSSAGALDIARAHGIEAVVLEPRDHPTREAFDKALIALLAERRVDLVCLAGFMRVLGPAFVQHFHGRLLNIHPALLPAFPGMHAQRQALAHGVKFAGATRPSGRAPFWIAGIGCMFTISMRPRSICWDWTTWSLCIGIRGGLSGPR